MPIPKQIKIFGADIDQLALQQFKKCCGQKFVVAAALMPDAHGGYVAPIGAVLKTFKAVVPSWVGYDIGCGMIAVRISELIDQQKVIREKAREIFNQVNRDVPMGKGRFNQGGRPNFMVEELEAELRKLKEDTCDENLWKEVKQKSELNLGTLGSGNHFIEILTSGDETWLVIHSGSRGVGFHVAVHFMRAASGKKRGGSGGYEQTYAIQDPDLRDEYMVFQKYCLEFALLNRLSMAVKVEKAIKQVTGIEYNTMERLWTNKNHNHCIELGNDTFLHRKGATSSDKGEQGVIPGSMKTGCYLVEGLGNEDFLMSSSHGAGRKMSRREAAKRVKLEEFKETMQGIVAPVNKKTIDESPFAYKDLAEVMTLQKDSVKIIKQLLPIINWKGF